MLPWKFRTNKIQEISFRNTFKGSIDLGINASYRIELTYAKPTFNQGQQAEEGATSSGNLNLGRKDSESMSTPCLDLNSKSNS